MISDITKDFAKLKEKELDESINVTREHEESSIKSRERNDFQRDYARILYSSSFRRLQGKMQLFEVDAGKFNRNRLTHSLEVAQIARGIAGDLGLKNPVVVELAALAHDIGNPPFGHSGERQLNKLAKNFGGYEGNAQALRILRTLEKKFPKIRGLDLTYRSLLSVVKYPFNKSKNSKKFLYEEDYLVYKEIISNFSLKLCSGEKTIDAQIMDLADEIAYAAHDLEDALSRNMVNIEDIEYEFHVSSDYKSALPHFKELVKKSKETAYECNILNSSEEFAMVFRKELTSNIVNTLCNDIKVIESRGFKELGFDNYQLLSEGLKKLLFKVIMRKRNILTYESKGNKIISDLFDFYIKEGNVDFISPELRFSLPEKGSDVYEDLKKRAVIDYISGMMDTFAILEWETHCK